MPNSPVQQQHYDYVIVGSGFGGSVSAYRLSQKGYKVLVIEKGKWYPANSFARSNWDFRRWIWMPRAGLQGIMKLTVLKHLNVLSGVGVGGGSLVYGATLPKPGPGFFQTGTWADLEDWQEVLTPFYDEAEKMLGVTENPNLTSADIVLRDLAKDMGREEHFQPTRVGVYFNADGNPGEPVPDPFFDGKGPTKRGCVECGRCMLGCPIGSKNSLDKNYLHLAQEYGAEVIAETEVVDVITAGAEDGSQGYLIQTQNSLGLRKRSKTVYATGVIFAGGVLGTVPLLQKLKRRGSLGRLSDKLGRDVRSNSETITSVTASDETVNYSEGVSIGSILHTDENSHVEPIVQGERSNGWKLLTLPRTQGKTFISRMINLFRTVAAAPKTYFDLVFAKNWGKRTLTLLFMQHLDSTLTLKTNWLGLPTTSTQDGSPPSCQIPESEDVTDRVRRITNGTVFTGATEAILGTPSTAHILGGCVMGESQNDGVIDKYNRVYNYQNMYVCDGSTISANPGVNPSLSITAITEHAMSHIEAKNSVHHGRDHGIAVGDRR